MNKHKTLLLSCFIENSPQAMPLATALLASTISDLSSIEARIMNYTVESDPSIAADQILAENPDSIGCSLYIWNSDFFYKLVSKIREKKNDLIIYAGGAEVTASVNKLSESKIYDYLIPGEGEIPFRKLMLSLTGHSAMPDSSILHKEHEMDLNKIPSPFLNGILKPTDYEGILWELSRGCPFNCAFCCESRGIRGVRHFSQDRIIRELELFEESGVDQIWVLDPTFNINKERALSIISLIEKKALQIHFTFEVRAELLDEELVEAFSQIHCSLQIGLQSSHNSVLQNLNRDINKELFKKKIDLLNRNGVVFGIDLIYGLPGDSPEGFLHSLDFALDLIPNHLDLFRLSVFPGTELYDNAENLEIQYLQKAPYEVISTKGFSEEELNKTASIADATDLFYNKGKAAPWLLPVLDYLEMEGSDFFKGFSEFVNDTGDDKPEILKLQTDFLINISTRDDNDEGMAVIMDLIHFHHLYSQSLFAQVEEQIQVTSENYVNQIYEKSPALKTGIFSFDVTLYWELGMFSIPSFINQYEREVSYGLFLNLGGDVSVMALEKRLYQFLQSIDGKLTIGEVLLLIKSETDELDEFIGFLIESGSIRPVSE